MVPQVLSEVSVSTANTGIPTTRKYNDIDVNGPINVVPVEPEEIANKIANVFIVMGPTGSGKSAFIQSLSEDGSLSISKDSLESVTQEVTCYHLIGICMKPGYAARENILMDTPGFLDTKLSETRVTGMIIRQLDRIRQLSEDTYVHLCYFQPITDIRLGGSKRGAIKLLRGFAESFGAERLLHVITTMWNNVTTEKQISDANARLYALKADIFKKSDQMDVSLTKFEFSPESVLEFVDSSNRKASKYWGLLAIADDRDTLIKSIHRENLLERISNLCQRLEFLAEDKQNVTVTTPGEDNSLLLEVIDAEESAVLKALEDFLYDLYQLDPASASTPFPTPESIPPPRLPSLGRSVRVRFKRFIGFIEQALRK